MAEIRFESYYGVAPLDGNYLMHHGTKGMKWYHRLYQHQDGSLTPLGRIHYGVGEKRKARTDHGDALKQFKKGLSDKDYAKAKDSERARNATKLAEIAKEASDRKGRISGKNSERLEEAAKKAGYNSLDEAIRKAANNEADKKQARKDKKIETLIKEGNVASLQRNLNKLSVDDLQKAASKAKSDADKRELLNEIRGEHIRRNQEIKGLKKARHEEEIEAAKKKAIESGDPRKIKKYLKNMTTNELQDAINRTEKMLKIESQAEDRAEKERILREAKWTAFKDAMEMTAYRAKKFAYDAQGLAIKTGFLDKQVVKEAPKDPRKLSDKDPTSGLTGKAKEVYEEGLGEYVKGKAKEKREKLDKMGISEGIREREVAKTLRESLPKSFFDDKGSTSKAEEKALKDAKAEVAKKLATQALNDQNGGTRTEREEMAKKLVKELYNPEKADKKEKQISDLRKRYEKIIEAMPKPKVSVAKEKSEIPTVKSAIFKRKVEPEESSKSKSVVARKIETPSVKSSLFNKRVDRSDSDETSRYEKAKRETISSLKRNNTILRAKSLKSSGLTLPEIAKRLGVSESTVSEYLKKK